MRNFRYSVASIILGFGLLACSSDSDFKSSSLVKKPASSDDLTEEAPETSENGTMGLNSRDATFPKTIQSPPEYIDSLDYIAPCRSVGCSSARTGGHNLHWYVTQSEGDRGRGYYVKGDDQRCWERLEWDGNSVSVTYDNCWWTPGYKYSRYVDGRWLARIWKPGDAIVTDHAVYGGNWDSCTDTLIGSGERRKMTFLWRVKDFDWGPAGRLDTIAIRQSYPHEPRIREHYFYARGVGLIAWNYENDAAPQEFKYHAFNLQSSLKPRPIGTKCVQVEDLTRPESRTPSRPPAKKSAASLPTTPSTQMPPEIRPVEAVVSKPTVSPIGNRDTGCTVTILKAGFAFSRNKPVYSCSKKYSLVFQQDGNLVSYDTSTAQAIWSSKTGQSGADTAVFQSDGNLVVYKNGTALWHSKSGGAAGAELLVQDDGNLVIRQMGRVVWASGSGR